MDDQTTMPPMLTVAGLSVWRGGHCLFEALDFELHAGQVALIVGPNGSGKTTLLRMLAGLSPPTEGRVRWEGADCRLLQPEQRAEIAYRGHYDGLKKDLTVYENLDFYRRLQQGTDSIEPLLEGLRLDARRDTRVRHLSAGQRRRTALAALKLSGARLWILDEPTTNLDADGRDRITDWVNEHVASGGMAVVATHHTEGFMRAGTLMVEL